jgi:hypothetical protein
MADEGDEVRRDVGRGVGIRECDPEGDREDDEARRQAC